MLNIRMTCDICLAQNQKEIPYDELPALRGLIDQYYTRIKDKSICKTCYSSYKVAKEEMRLRHEAEVLALLDAALNP